MQSRHAFEGDFLAELRREGVHIPDEVIADHDRLAEQYILFSEIYEEERRDGSTHAVAVERAVALTRIAVMVTWAGIASGRDGNA
ncbi:MAG: hypothetical protein AAB592_04945 [Patescibacteria group bacterium]